MRTNLATSLVYFQSPKNHPEARSLFDDVLSRQPNATAALLGVGLIHEEREDFIEAEYFLDRALSRDPQNVRISAESAWCKALTGNVSKGLEQLKRCLEQINAMKATPYDLKAQVSYRIGKCSWDFYTDKESRKDRSGPYSYFLSAIRANPSYGPAYTSLGRYYSSYAKDKRRARQCFQKAFELSAGEVFAAEQLARTFADDANWDIVEVIAQRVIDSGIVRPAPGSKRKAFSWPFAALAIVQMNKQEYPLAVHSYQAALRITPSDYHCWVGLGESYLSSGRYTAASKALEHAEMIMVDSEETEDVWFARYMHSNVHRELGDFDEAIAGYRLVLKSRSEEFGVSIALLQSLVESSRNHVEMGSFGKAADLAKEAIIAGLKISRKHTPSVNFWKAIGDACMIFGSIPALAHALPVDALKTLLSSECKDLDGLLSNLDDIGVELTTADDSSNPSSEKLQACLVACIVAQKQAIAAASKDSHARSVAWYNLGWSEYHSYHLTSGAENEKTRTKFARCARAAVMCFKHAIELEASNADFWNALGVATTSLNPKIAQHSLVRSLHLNERSARAWTNLGSLYMLQQDYELAHQAFGRAQSTDPDYVYAWLGEGLIALHLGDQKEAPSHFRHAMEIGEASDMPVKQQYVAASFDELLSSNSKTAQILEDLVTPIFALQQIERQSINPLPYQQLLTQYLERAGDFETSLALLQTLSDQVESTYEDTESASALGRYVRLKSDLARSQLASHDYQSAIEAAGTSLDLAEDMEPGALSVEDRAKARLSAHMTAGLAHYYQDNMAKAIDMFRAALEESNSDPDVVCLLAQVLWAKGSDDERGVAKDQLLDCIDKNSGHVGATTLLGAMSAIDGDEQTHEAVLSDLQSMRVSPDLTLDQQQKIEMLLTMSAALSASENSYQEMNQIERSIMLGPVQPSGWSNLAEHSNDQHAAEMALAAVARAVAPEG